MYWTKVLLREIMMLSKNHTSIQLGEPSVMSLLRVLLLSPLLRYNLGYYTAPFGLSPIPLRRPSNGPGYPRDFVFRIQRARNYQQH